MVDGHDKRQFGGWCSAHTLDIFVLSTVQCACAVSLLQPPTARLRGRKDTATHFGSGSPAASKNAGQYTAWNLRMSCMLQPYQARRWLRDPMAVACRDSPCQQSGGSPARAERLREIDNTAQSRNDYVWARGANRIAQNAGRKRTCWLVRVARRREVHSERVEPHVDAVRCVARHRQRPLNLVTQTRHCGAACKGQIGSQMAAITHLKCLPGRA